MRSTHYLTAVLSLAIAGVASASVIPFDPDGPGPAPVAMVGSIDLIPGNAIYLGFGTDDNHGNLIGYESDFFYQARVGGLLDGSGHVIPTPGLNSTYQLTAVFGVTVIDIPTSANSITFSSLTSPDPVFGSLYSYLYYSTDVSASDLAGTGFHDGTRILTANPTSAFGSLAGFHDPTLVDAFNPANYPGILTDITSGGLKVGADALDVNSAFFPGGSAFSFVTDTTLATPFFHTDPANLFITGAGDMGDLDFIPLNFDFNSNFVNAQFPFVFTDGLLEADASIGFVTVPEPTAVVLLPPAALLAARRRRSRGLLAD